MRTNIDIDEELISKVMKVLKVKTKKEAVDLALKEILRDNARLEVLKMRGTGWGWQEDEQSVSGTPPRTGSGGTPQKQRKVKRAPHRDAAQKQTKSSHAD